MASPVVYQSYAQADSRGPRLALYLGAFAVTAFIVWPVFAELDEAAAGLDKVTPSSRQQVIQPLDPAQALVSEAEARITALRARAERIRAEIGEQPDVAFSADFDANSEVVRRERELFTSNRRVFRENMANMRQRQRLADRELRIAIPLLSTGAVSETEVLRLKARLIELTAKLEAMRSEYFVNLNNDLDKTMSELESLLKQEIECRGQGTSP
jgi:adhesin transport system membrane fusion protein